MTRHRHPALAICIAAALAACSAPMPTPSGAPGMGRAVPDVRAEPADCHAGPDPARPQYVIGYGSLMQDESRRRTSPQAGPAHPVEISGWRRGWFAKGDPLGFSTTYLGVVRQAGSRVNAVIYRVDAAELLATDRREAFYCRAKVAAADIRTIGQEPFDVSDGEAWIYANRPESIAIPSARYPIVQSYVDIFVSGCLEQEQRYALDGFARQCLATTSDWSAHWINDRVYPRRPFIHQPKARQIDELLSRQVPQYFSEIRIQ